MSSKRRKNNDRKARHDALVRNVVSYLSALLFLVFMAYLVWSAISYTGPKIYRSIYRSVEPHVSDVLDPWALNRAEKIQMNRFIIAAIDAVKVHPLSYEVNPGYGTVGDELDSISLDYRENDHEVLSDSTLRVTNEVWVEPENASNEKQSGGLNEYVYGGATADDLAYDLFDYQSVRRSCGQEERYPIHRDTIIPDELIAYKFATIKGCGDKFSFEWIVCKSRYYDASKYADEPAVGAVVQPDNSNAMLLQRFIEERSILELETEADYEGFIEAYGTLEGFREYLQESEAVDFMPLARMDYHEKHIDYRMSITRDCP